MKDDETIFLSTPSVRRATCEAQMIDTELVISIHALREEGDTQLLNPAVIDFQISIHALREEGDQPLSMRESRSGDFYPRPP